MKGRPLERRPSPFYEGGSLGAGASAKSFGGPHMALWKCNPPENAFSCQAAAAQPDPPLLHKCFFRTHHLLLGFEKVFGGGTD